MKRILSSLFLCLAGIPLYAQDTTQLNVQFEKSKENELVIQQFFKLDTIVRKQLDPAVIDSLKQQDKLVFISYDSSTNVGARKYRYDSLALEFSAAHYELFNSINDQGLLPGLRKLADKGMLYIMHRGLASGIDDPERTGSSVADAAHYLRLIRKQFEVHKDELAAAGWTIARYTQWESTRTPPTELTRMLARQTFLKMLKTEFGYDY